LVLFLKLETTVLGSLDTSFSAPSSRVLIVLLFVRLTKVGVSDMQDRDGGRRSREVYHTSFHYGNASLVHSMYDTAVTGAILSCGKRLRSDRSLNYDRSTRVNLDAVVGI
jgi:hypothetical protein